MNPKNEIVQETKEWEKPQLIVLTRGEPEEAVLGNCKISDEGSTGLTCATGSCAGTSAS